MKVGISEYMHRNLLRCVSLYVRACFFLCIFQGVGMLDPGDMAVLYLPGHCQAALPGVSPGVAAPATFLLALQHASQPSVSSTHVYQKSYSSPSLSYFSFLGPREADGAEGGWTPQWTLASQLFPPPWL